MAQIQGIFINARTKDAFLERLRAGDVKNTQIAFIKDTNEIWTLDHYYKVDGLNELEVVDLINRYGGGVTLEEFKGLLLLVSEGDFSTAIQNIFNKANSALQSGDVYSWALSTNNDKIPENKLLELLIPGYLYNNRFFTTKSGSTYTNEVTASGNKFYYDKDTNKLYVYLNYQFTQISGNTGEQPDDLSAYLLSSVAEQTYTTKNELLTAISDLVNGAPEAYNTLKELADALLLNSGDITDILSALNNYYTKTEADDKFLTSSEASNTYVTKSDFNYYLLTITNELNAIRDRLYALEHWTDIPEEGTNYYYKGTVAPTSLSECTLVEEYPSEDTYTNNSGAKSHIFVLTNSDKTVTFVNPELNSPVTQADVDTTTLSGFKIFETAVGTANGKSIKIIIS